MYYSRALAYCTYCTGAELNVSNHVLRPLRTSWSDVSRLGPSLGLLFAAWALLISNHSVDHCTLTASRSSYRSSIHSETLLVPEISYRTNKNHGYTFAQCQRQRIISKSKAFRNVESSAPRTSRRRRRSHWPIPIQTMNACVKTLDWFAEWSTRSIRTTVSCSSTSLNERLVTSWPGYALRHLDCTATSFCEALSMVSWYRVHRKWWRPTNKNNNNFIIHVFREKLEFHVCAQSHLRCCL